MASLSLSITNEFNTPPVSDIIPEFKVWIRNKVHNEVPDFTQMNTRFSDTVREIQGDDPLVLVNHSSLVVFNPRPFDALKGGDRFEGKIFYTCTESRYGGVILDSAEIQADIVETNSILPGIKQYSLENIQYRLSHGSRDWKNFE